MFTGLIETLGTIASLEREDASQRLTIAVPDFASQTTIGESVAVNGVCLTVIAHDAEFCQFQAGPETLERSNLGQLQVGDRVNLERSLRMGDRLGGHLVQGHVDGVGRIASRHSQGEWEMLWFSCPAELTRQMVSKGSIAVDGISLTLVDVADNQFSIALIPHTLERTTLGFKPVGAAVNLETDLFAKYAWKCLEHLRKDSHGS